MLCEGLYVQQIAFQHLHHVSNSIRIAQRRQNGNSRASKTPSLNDESFLAGKKKMLDEGNFMFAKLARVTNCQCDVAIKDVQDTLAYTIHKFLVTVRYDGFAQFWLGRRGYVKSVVM